MIAIVAWARRVLDGIRFGHRAAADAEVEQWARRFFQELKASWPFQPGPDLTERVLRRLREHEDHDDAGKRG